MTEFSAYLPALAAVALFALLTQIVGMIAGFWKTLRKIVPGATPPADYADPLYRASRASSNAIETMGVLAAVVFAAILAGADPLWVNRLALASLMARFCMIVVHLGGIGRPDRSWRTLFFMVGLAAHAGLAVLVVLRAV